MYGKNKTTGRRRQNNAAAAMRPLETTIAATVLIGAAAATMGSREARAQAIYRYDITEIAKPAGVESIVPSSLSEMGKVTGTTRLNNASGGYAFLWRPSAPNGVTSLEGVMNINGASEAHGVAIVDKAGVNDPVNSGTVLGYQSIGGIDHRSFFWAGGTVYNTPGYSDLYRIHGVDLNASRSTIAQGYGSSDYGLFKPLNQPWVDIGRARENDRDTYVLGINDLNQVVGYTRNAQTAAPHAFLWKQGATDGIAYNPQMRELGEPQGYVGSYAYDVNNREQVIGALITGNYSPCPFIWTRQGGFKNLPNKLTGDTGITHPVTPNDINNYGQIVSQYYNYDARGGAVLYTSQTGMIPVSSLVNPAALPVLPLDNALAINDRGQILTQTVQGTPGQEGPDYHSTYLLTPRWQYGVVDAATDGAFNRTTLLWRNDTTGQFAVWRLTENGVVDAAKLFGAVDGYQPVALATGANERTRVLLVGPDGRSVVWTLSPNLQTIEKAATLPVAAGYVPVHIAVGSGANGEHTRVGLYNAQTRSYALWYLSDAGVVNAAGVFKNIKDYTPVSLAIGSDDKPRLLLKSDTPTGKAALWTFTVTGQVLVSGKILAVGGDNRADWDAATVGATPGNAPLTLMWKNRANFQTAVWTIGPQTGAVLSGKTFNPVAHAATRGVTIGSDQKPRLLWQYDDGRAALWRLSPACALEAGYSYKADK